MAISRIQSVSNVVEATTLPLTLAFNPAYTVVCVFASKNPGGVHGVTCPGKSFGRIYQRFDSSTNVVLEVWLGVGPATSNVVTVTSNASTHMGGMAAEYTGLAQNPIDLEAFAQGSSTSLTAPALGPSSKADHLELTSFASRRGMTGLLTMTGVPWTTLANVVCNSGGAHVSMGVQDQIKTAVSSIPSTSVTATNSDQWVAQSVILTGAATVTDDPPDINATSTVVGAAALIKAASSTLAATSALPNIPDPSIFIHHRIFADASLAATSALPNAATKLFRRLTANALAATSAVPAVDGLTLSIDAQPIVVTSDVGGSAGVTSATLNVASLDITTAEGGGGEKFTLIGAFPAGPFRVHVGPTGTAADPKAASGVPGAPDPISDDGTTLVAYLPVLDPGTYNVFVTNGTLEDSLPAAITVVKPNYRSGAFNVRSAFSPMFATGPRSVDKVPA